MTGNKIKRERERERKKEYKNPGNGLIATKSH